MFAAYFEDLTWQHVDNEETVEKIKNNPVLLQIYNTLTIGVNVSSFSAYNKIAEYVAKLSGEEAKKITFQDVVNNVGYYEDTSGVLV